MRTCLLPCSRPRETALNYLALFAGDTKGTMFSGRSFLRNLDVFCAHSDAPAAAREAAPSKCQAPATVLRSYGLPASSATMCVLAAQAKARRLRTASSWWPVYLEHGVHGSIAPSLSITISKAPTPGHQPSQLSRVLRCPRSSRLTYHAREKSEIPQMVICEEIGVSLGERGVVNLVHGQVAEEASPAFCMGKASQANCFSSIASQCKT